MPIKKTPTSLKSEVAKLAKLTNIQNGLPPTLRAVPALAIFAGEIISKAVGGANVVEERMLGVDETKIYSLKAPSAESRAMGTEGGEETEKKGLSCAKGKKNGLEVTKINGP